MSEEVLIKAENVSKKFCKDLKRSLFYGAQELCAEFFGLDSGHFVLREKEFWALRDVSFSVRRGECLALIGRNGSGKSTLLSILNGIIKPDGGRIEMRGRVTALIQLGAGFNPILTGRENIYINGQILGFTKKEIDRKFDEIVAFSELAEFIDTPVRSYSSGMKVRLGFAVAAQMDPDIMLLDEVMAVGDIGFKVKCINRITELMERTAVILVTHSMPEVGRVASGVLMLNKGVQVYYTNNVPEGIEKYYNEFTGGKMSVFGDVVKIERICVYSASTAGTSKSIVQYGEDMFIEIDFQPNTKHDGITIGIPIFDIDQKNVAATGVRDVPVRNGEMNRIRIKLQRNQFNSGTYFINLLFSYRIGDKPIILTRVVNAHQFQVTGSVRANHAPFQLLNEWELKRGQV
jgi:lipopolysaccharide transport system ATP-binding protein